MALNGTLGLGFVLTAKDGVTSVLSAIEKKFKGFDGATAEALGNFKKNAVQLAAGAGIAAAGIAGLSVAFSTAKSAGQFEQAMTAVKAVTRATAQEFAMLKKSAIDAGINTQFSPTEAAEGLKELATAGQTVRQATQTLIPVLDLAAGSLGDVGVSGAAAAVVGTLNSYNMAADQAAVVTDKLLKTTLLTNFTAKDFEAGLAKAAVAGASFDQSLNDVLISMGLLRNRNIDASSASTDFREATRRLASDHGAQQAVAKTGIKIFDEQSNKMRSILDIINDMIPSMEKLGVAEKQEIMVKAFGARGMALYGAVQSAAFTQTKNGIDVTYKGAEAIRVMRQEMDNATGTAQEFRDQMLDTFQGQQTLLKGSVETLKILLGEGFAAAFKPIVGFVVKSVNAIIAVVQSVPAPIKETFAKMFLAASALLTVFGGFVMLKAGLFILATTMSFLGVTFGTVVAALWPIVAAFAALSLGIYAFYVLVKKNIGGVGDIFRDFGSKVLLFFKSVGQAIGQGGFSGDVMKALNTAGNEGVKAFAIKVFLWFNRIKNFFTSLVDGISAGLQAAAPVFGILVASFSNLADALGLTSASAGENRTAFEKWGDAGRMIGKVIAGVVDVIALAMIPVVWTLTAAVEVLKAVWGSVGPIIGDVIDIFVSLFNIVGSLFTGGWSGIWDGAINILLSAFSIIMHVVTGLLRAVGSVFDGLANTFGVDLGIRKAIDQLNAGIDAGIRDVKIGVGTIDRPMPSPARGAMQGSAAMVTAAQAPLMSAINANSSGSGPAIVTVNVPLHLDGKKVGHAMAKVKREHNDSAFTPVGGSENMSF